MPVDVYSLLSVRRLYSIYRLTFGPDFRFYGESHNFWELDYIISGSASITSADKVYYCKTGDIVLHRPMAFHTSKAEGRGRLETLMIAFDGEGFEQGVPDGKFTLGDCEKTCLDYMMLELPAVFAGYDINEYERLRSLSPPDDVGYQLIKSYLEILCLSLKRRGKDAAAPPSDSEKAVRYARVIAFLREHVEDNLTIEDICRGVYETPGTLKLLFRRFTGVGVIRYYNRLRCEHCMRLLAGDMPIAELSDRMRFSLPCYFSYFFKRETGETPSEYRKRLNSDSGGAQRRKNYDGK